MRARARELCQLLCEPTARPPTPPSSDNLADIQPHINCVQHLGARGKACLNQTYRVQAVGVPGVRLPAVDRKSLVSLLGPEQTTWGLVHDDRLRFNSTQRLARPELWRGSSMTRPMAINATDAISTYILAKDSNRPQLMKDAFAEDCELEMAVKSDAISFPSSAKGLQEVTSVLVTDFGNQYENVRTFCLSRPGSDDLPHFHCQGREEPFASDADATTGISAPRTGSSKSLRSTSRSCACSLPRPRSRSCVGFRRCRILGARTSEPARAFQLLVPWDRSKTSCGRLIKSLREAALADIW